MAKRNTPSIVSDRHKLGPRLGSVEYDKYITYEEDNALPTVRLPNEQSVPDHLIWEFKQLFPPKINDNRKGKIHLEPSKKMDERSYQLLKWNKQFWTPENLDILTNIVLKKSEVNLSILDWFCVNYSKEHQTTITSNDGTVFYVNEEYNKNLLVFTRPYFDVFSRDQRILVEYEDIYDNHTVTDKDRLEIEWDGKKEVGKRVLNGKVLIYLVTAVRQLMFFHWAIKNNIIKYCIENVAQLRQDLKAKKEHKIEVITGKRRRLTEPPSIVWRFADKPVTLTYSGT